MTRFHWYHVASVLPEWVLRFMNRHWKLHYDPSDGWTFWLDASYLKYVRREKRKRKYPWDE